VSDRVRMTAEVDDAVLALQLATRIHGLVKVRHDILDGRRTNTSNDSTPATEGYEWIGHHHTRQDPEIAAICDALAALLRGGRK
jgi:sugar lactone lactonase YvrE